MINGVVYCIFCHKTKKSYVGVTQNTPSHRRWLQHLRAAKKGLKGPLLAAIRKHGEEQFTFIILQNNFISRKALHLSERRWIKKLKTIYPHGYNITCGGMGPGYGPAFRKRMKLAYKNPQARLNVSLALRGNPNVSAATFRSWKNPVWRKKTAAAISKGTRNNPRVREARRRNWRNPTIRRKICSSIKRNWSRDIFRRKMGKIHKKSHQDPKVKRHHSVGMKLKWKDPAYRKKHAAAMSKISKRSKP